MSETGMQVFKFEEQNVRIEQENGDFLFHAGDVCGILGYVNATDVAC